MFFKLLHNNSLPVIFLTPVLAALLWIRMFCADIVHFTGFDTPAMPLWDYFMVPAFAGSQFPAALTSLLIVITTGITVNRIVSRHALLEKQSMMPLLIFVLLNAAFIPVQRLNPVWLFTFFFTLAAERLFACKGQKISTPCCFDAAMLTGIGALFYVKGIFFLPMLLIIMGILRMASFKGVVASVLGLAFPFIISFTWFFLFDNELWFISQINENIIANTGQYNHTIYSQSYIALIITFIVLSAITAIRDLNLQKIAVRRYLRIFIWLILYTGALTLTPFFSMEMSPLIATGSAVIIAFRFEKIKNNRFRELLFLILILSTIAIQIIEN
ncbi:hypothetical protein QA597_11590 [Marinilabiliaceae bacterium ANBcel2]|nr:hypothetical protein [Marinilabiliaceae bacterium ANBcel2]